MLFIQHSGGISPSSRTNRCKSVRNSSTVSSGRRRHVVNCSKATNESVPQAFIRACLISSTSSCGSFDSCRYVSRVAPFNCSGKTRSTLVISPSSLVNTRSSNHFIIGISVAATPILGISRISNCLDAMVNKAEIAWNLLTACDQSRLSHLPRQYTGSLSPFVKQQIQQPQCWDYSFYTSSGWLKFAYVTNPVPPKASRMTYKLHSQGHSTFRFFYTSGTPHAKHIRARFERWGRPFRSSLLAFFFLPSFWCWYERNSIHTASLSYFISLFRPAHHLFFYPTGMAAGCMWMSALLSAYTARYSLSLWMTNPCWLIRGSSLRVLSFNFTIDRWKSGQLTDC